MVGDQFLLAVGDQGLAVLDRQRRTIAEVVEATEHPAAQVQKNFDQCRKNANTGRKLGVRRTCPATGTTTMKTQPRKDRHRRSAAR
jgi:hypothetical protein